MVVRATAPPGLLDPRRGARHGGVLVRHTPAGRRHRRVPGVAAQGCSGTLGRHRGAGGGAGARNPLRPRRRVGQRLVVRANLLVVVVVLYLIPVPLYRRLMWWGLLF